MDIQYVHDVKVIFATEFKPLNAVMWESYDTAVVFAFATPPFFLLWSLCETSSSQVTVLTGGGRFAGCWIHQADYFTAHSQAERSNPNPPPPPFTHSLSLSQEVSRSGFTHRLTWCRGLQRGPKPALQCWKLLFKTPRWGRSFADGTVPEMLSRVGFASGLALDRGCSSKKPGQGIFLTWNSPCCLSC